MIPSFDTSTASLPSEQEKLIYLQEKTKERQAVVNQVINQLICQQLGRRQNSDRQPKEVRAKSSVFVTNFALKPIHLTDLKQKIQWLSPLVVHPFTGLIHDD